MSVVAHLGPFGGFGARETFLCLQKFWPVGLFLPSWTLLERFLDEVVRKLAKIVSLGPSFVAKMLSEGDFR